MTAYPGRPVGIHAPHGARVFEVRWPGERTDKIPHEILREYCPCAGCQGHSAQIVFQPGNNLELREITPVGNYALSLTWGDGHSTGIYSFEYLWRLSVVLEKLGQERLAAQEQLPPLPAT